MRYIHSSILFFLIICVSILQNCSTYENNSVTTVNLDTGLGISKSTASKGTAPAGIASMVLTVTGSGMETITETISTSGAVSSRGVAVYNPESGVVTLDVPTGSERTFQVTASTASVAFFGDTVRDLSSGGSLDVEVQMSLTSTKLIIPDYGNDRLVQVDSLDGTDTEINSTWKANDFGLGPDFDPVDVDFGPDGKIYIANSSTGTYERVLVAEDIDSSTLLSTNFPNSRWDITAIAVDRENGYVYYAWDNGDFLVKADLDGNDIVTALDIGSITGINGLDVDENGILFIAWSDGNSSIITAYNPEGTGTSLHNHNADSGTGNGAYDVIVNSSNIYLIGDNPSTTSSVYQYTYNSTTQQLIPGSFYDTDVTDCRRFIKSMGNSIIFTDEQNGSPSNRLIKIEDITGNSRRNYGETGSGIGEFSLFFSDGEVVL